MAFVQAKVSSMSSMESKDAVIFVRDVVLRPTSKLGTHPLQGRVKLEFEGLKRSKTVVTLS